MNKDMEEYFGPAGEVPIQQAIETARKIAGVGTDEIPSERSRKMKANRRLGNDLERRGRKWLQDEGWTVFRVSQAQWTGKNYVSRDFAGIGDILACKPRHFVLVNVTTDGPEVDSHIRKFVTDKVEGHTGQAQWAATRQWLSVGAILILAYAKLPNGHWAEPREVWLSLEELQMRRGKYEGRKR